MVDDGPGARSPAPGSGVGLVAMQERVAVVGGSLEAGPRAEGGWAVRAVLPLERAGARL